MSSQPVARAAASELAACGAGRSPRMRTSEPCLCRGPQPEDEDEQ